MPRSPAPGRDGPAATTPLLLVVLGDSTSFTDDTGPRLPDHPGLYPNVAARRLEQTLGRPVRTVVVARAGLGVREAVRMVTKDRHVQFDLLARADAVVVGVGSFDHAPAGLPPVVEAVLPYLTPTALRRFAHRGVRLLHPQLVRLSRSRRHRTPPAEFERLFRLLLDQIRGLTWGRAAGVVLGPTSHRSPYYGRRHPRHRSAETLQLALARDHGFATVPVWEHVRPHLDRLNLDGIHWPGVVHDAVGAALAGALVPQLVGSMPPVGLPARFDVDPITPDR